MVKIQRLFLKTHHENIHIYLDNFQSTFHVNPSQISSNYSLLGMPSSALSQFAHANPSNAAFGLPCSTPNSTCNPTQVALQGFRGEKGVMGVEPKRGVGPTPQNGWFISWKTLLKIPWIWGPTPIFRNTHIMLFQ